MRILITGATGFIGSCLTKKLVSLGHTVFTTGKSNEQNINTQCISYTFHDINWSAISPIDAVFHQAAISDTTHPNPSDFYLVNVDYSKILLEQAITHNCKNFIYASSCAVYGACLPPFKEEDANSKTPLNHYGLSKYCFDEIAMTFNKINIVGLRYSNVYGLGENHKNKSSSMIYQLIKQRKNPKLFKYGEQKRDFIHIDDVIDANLLALNSISGIYNVGSGIATSFNEVVDIIHDGKVKITYIDNPYKESYQNYTLCDLTKSNKLLKYEPKITLKNGIKSYITEMGALLDHRFSS